MPRNIHAKISVPTQTALYAETTEFVSRAAIDTLSGAARASSHRDETSACGSVPVKPYTVGSVGHKTVTLHDIEPGDVCFMVSRSWGKTFSHHFINAMQRLHTGKPMGLPGLHPAGSSVDVVHAAIVVDVNAALGEITLAESNVPSGLRRAVMSWHRPEDPDSNIDPSCSYVFYRMRSAADARQMADIAHTWAGVGAAYANVGAALVVLLPNSPHLTTRRDLLVLAALAGASPKHAWPKNPMICSQFVARVWGAIAAARAMDPVIGGAHARTAHQQRRAAARDFPCSTWNVLPARLHDGMSRHADFVPVGVLHPR